MTGFTMETGVVDAATVAELVGKEAAEALTTVKLAEALAVHVRVANGKVKLWGGPAELNHGDVAEILSAHLPEAVATGQNVEVLALTSKGAKVRLVPVPGDEDVAAEPAEEESDAEGPE